MAKKVDYALTAGAVSTVRLEAQKELLRRGRELEQEMRELLRDTAYSIRSRSVHSGASSFFTGIIDPTTGDLHTNRVDPANADPTLAAFYEARVERKDGE